MADDVIMNKAAVIERCVRRAREEYNQDQQRLRQTLPDKMPPISNAWWLFEILRCTTTKVVLTPILVSIITNHLDDFLQFSKALLLQSSSKQ